MTERETRRAVSAELGTGDRGRVGGRGPWHWVEWVNRRVRGAQLCATASTCSPALWGTWHVWCVHVSEVTCHATCDLVTSVTCVGSGWGPMSEPVYTHRSRSQALEWDSPPPPAPGSDSCQLWLGFRGEEAPMSHQPMVTAAMYHKLTFIVIKRISCRLKNVKSCVLSLWLSVMLMLFPGVWDLFEVLHSHDFPRNQSFGSLRV